MESSKSSIRLSTIANHLVLDSQQTYNAGKVLPQSDEDIVIVAMARTAMTKAGKGL